MTQRLLTVLAGLVLAACAPAAGPPDGDLQALQGAWVLESLEIDSEVVAVDSLGMGCTALAPRLTVEGQRYTLSLAGGALALVCRLGPGHSPKRITLTALDGPWKGETFRGIYKLEGDRLTICRPLDPAQPRPAAFMTRPDSGLMLGVWKRARP